MAEEVEMTPVEAAEPPKANPLAAPAAPLSETAPVKPVARPAAGATATTLKPGLRLPPKPAVGATALKPGLKLPTQNALKPGLKLPPKPGTAAAPAATLKPGLKLPTQNALKPGVRLPPKPVIRRPGATAVASPLPKPIPKPVVPAAPAAAAPAAAPAPAPAAPAAPAAAAPVAPAAAPVAPVASPAPAPAASAAPAAPAAETPTPMEALKTITQTLKGITQEIPAQAILRKTGIIAEGAMSDAQKEAAKHKTARISLSDAMGVAPVQNENAPMKTIRIKRPVDLSADAAAKPAAAAPAGGDTAATKAEPASTATQRKTLKITRPGSGVVRPAKFGGVKRPATSPSQAQTAVKDPAAADAPVADIPEIADIPDIPPMPAAQAASAGEDIGPAWAWTLSALLQAAACVAIGALAWMLYQNTQTAYF